MFADDIRRALPGTPRERLAELAAAVWKGFACGAVSEEDAQQLAEEIAARKIVPPKPAAPRKPVGSPPALPGPHGAPPPLDRLRLAPAAARGPLHHGRDGGPVDDRRRGGAPGPVPADHRPHRDAGGRRPLDGQERRPAGRGARHPHVARNGASRRGAARPTRSASSRPSGAPGCGCGTGSGQGIIHDRQRAPPRGPASPAA